MRFISNALAQQIDRELMDPAVGGFSLDQLMELAGLSVAQAIAQEYPTMRRVCIVAGPGNNGGDGLVAARHLHHFGYRPTVVYPKPSSRFAGLQQQLRQLSIPVHTTFPSPAIEVAGLEADVLVDGVFGFGFATTGVGGGEAQGSTLVRAPFDRVLPWMAELRARGTCQLVSIDVPSGWGDAAAPSSDDGSATSLPPPDMVISLSAPKTCMRGYQGVHYLGGRFLPDELVARLQLQLPAYPGTAQCLRLPVDEPGLRT